MTNVFLKPRCPPIMYARTTTSMPISLEELWMEPQNMKVKVLEAAGHKVGVPGHSKPVFIGGHSLGEV